LKIFDKNQQFPSGPEPRGLATEASAAALWAKADRQDLQDKQKHLTANKRE
jgi:hypothetical protein